jgi:hypothetical protein
MLSANAGLIVAATRAKAVESGTTNLGASIFSPGAENSALPPCALAVTLTVPLPVKTEGMAVRHFHLNAAIGNAPPVV